MKVPIGIPISQINIGERLYISINDILLEQKDTEQGFEVWLYIGKTALLRRLTSDLGDLPIERKGPGMTSGDFFIDFSDIGPRIDLYTKDTIELSYYLSPVKIEYAYEDIDDGEGDEIQKTPSQKPGEDLSLSMDLLQQEIKGMSIEELYKMEASYKDYVDEIRNSENGVERKFYMWLFDQLWVMTENQRRILEKRLAKPLEELTPAELDQRLSEATLREDYDTCSRIRDLKQTYNERMEKKDSETGWLYHPFFCYIDISK